MRGNVIIQDATSLLFAVVNYEQAVEPFRQTDRLSNSERAMLMGGACAKAYGWSPKKGWEIEPGPEVFDFP